MTNEPDIYANAFTDEEVLRVAFNDVRASALIGGCIVPHPKTSVIIELLAKKKGVTGDYLITAIRIFNEQDIEQLIRENAGRLA